MIFSPQVTTVPEAFQMMQQKSEGPVPVVPYMTIGKREEVYDEPPPKRTYKHRNHGSGKKDPVCGICLSGPEKNKNGMFCSRTLLFFAVLELCV